MESSARPVKVLGIGGTTRDGSSTESAVRAVLETAASLGAETTMLSGADLVLPLYPVHSADRDDAALRLLDSVRRADGLVIGSPGYHGSISGVVKNVLDYLEDLRSDERPYLDGVPVGVVTCAFGAQAAVGTLGHLRSVVHALRGWPTPLGVPIDSSTVRFDPNVGCSDSRTADQLALMAEQIMDFAAAQRSRRVLELSALL